MRVWPARLGREGWSSCNYQLYVFETTEDFCTLGIQSRQRYVALHHGFEQMSSHLVLREYHQEQWWLTYLKNSLCADCAEQRVSLQLDQTLPSVWVWPHETKRVRHDTRSMIKKREHCLHTAQIDSVPFFLFLSLGEMGSV